MEVALSSCEINGMDVQSVNKLSNLEYVDGVVPLSEESSKMQVFFDCLDDSVNEFGMCSRPSSCKMLLPELVL